MKISAVIVTYNRLDLLKECIRAIQRQTQPVAHLIVIDNHSDDPTRNYLQQLGKQIDYVRLEENLGGAGGFHAGVKYFIEATDDDFVWLMDDDTIPDSDALSALMNGFSERPNASFLASNPKWIDGSPAIMNVPVVAHPVWTSGLTAKSCLIEIQRASFVSIIVPRQQVLHIGLPLKQFFIWGDDTEYTERLVKQDHAYLVPQSIVVHKMKLNRGVNILEDDTARVDRYFFAYRNRLFNSRRRSKKEIVHYYIQFVNTVLHLLFGHTHARWAKLRVIFKGMLAGLFFNPKVEFSKSKNI